mmetsp:Transcript_14973/g.47169  ORF Transcript_14973/g.47169 Transcript_14973/m.47169 type:complete len:873 (+) Transcript_14973:76-2694(+)
MVAPGTVGGLLLLLLCLAAHVASGKKVEVNEVTFDSAVADIQWFGADQRTVLVQTNSGRLYRSTDGGNKWSEISDQLKLDSTDSSSPSITVDQIIKSQADPSTLLIAGTKRSHYLSVNAGATWRRVRQKSTIHTFMFHPKRPKWALLSTWTDACEGKSAKSKDGSDDGDDGPCNHMLYLTKDLGKTFTLVSSYVVQFNWGDVSHSQQDRIYFTHFRQKTGDQPKLYMWSENVDFAYTDDAGKKVNRLIHMGNKFMVSHSFIFVAKLKEQKGQTVSLMVSSDGGGTFRAARLPQDIDEKSYTVLDTSEGTVMLHVNHGSREPFNVGNIYVSDKDGVRYTLSLPNNVRGSNGNCEFDKVLHLEGVYLANFKDIQRTGDADGGRDKKAEAAKEAEELEQSSTGTEVEKRRTPKSKAKDESVVRTVISFDKGGVWTYLKPPKVDSRGARIECPPERCWLHLHGISNFQNYAPFYSTENAVGIIMGTGNVGPYLRFEPDQTNTYLSRDGGLTWVEAHKGAFIYEFGDHGGLVVMADDVRKTKQVVFSWNEGQSWYDFELGSSPVEVDNIVTEPNATSTKFLLYGTRNEAGVMYHMDFEALGQPLCKGVWAADSVSSDYETWSPSDGKNSEKCMLGRQVTYTRRKATSECFNGEQFERPVGKKSCACTEEDYECEMGFTRQVGSMECKYTDDGSIPIPDRCKSVDEFKVVAHRKVVGNSCEGGWRPEKAAVPCPKSAKLSKGAMSVLSSMVFVGTMMGGVFFLSRSEKFKEWFTNNGFSNFNAVKYSSIGALAPETALESVGARDDYGSEDEFRDPGARSGRYGGSSPPRREPEAPRRIDTAAEKVPKLQKPPGGGGGGGGGLGAASGDGGDDGMDLL